MDDEEGDYQEMEDNYEEENNDDMEKAPMNRIKRATIKNEIVTTAREAMREETTTREAQRSGKR